MFSLSGNRPQIQLFAGVAPPRPSDLKSELSNEPPKIRVRQLFPETWIWPAEDIFTRFERNLYKS